MKKKNEMLALSTEIELKLEAALKLHGIEVAYDALTEKQAEAWDELHSRLNRMRGMILAHIRP